MQLQSHYKFLFDIKLNREEHDLSFDSIHAYNVSLNFNTFIVEFATFKRILKIKLILRRSCKFQILFIAFV